MELKLIDNKGDNTLEKLISKKITKHSKIWSALQLLDKV